MAHQITSERVITVSSADRVLSVSMGLNTLRGAGGATIHGIWGGIVGGLYYIVNQCSAPVVLKRESADALEHLRLADGDVYLYPNQCIVLVYCSDSRWRPVVSPQVGE